MPKIARIDHRLQENSLGAILRADIVKSEIGRIENGIKPWSLTTNSSILTQFPGQNMPFKGGR